MTSDFNPRPREEGDILTRRPTVEQFYFNPRPREEGDKEGGCMLLRAKISIHALVKRATIVINGSWRYPSHFNPRPREEGDKLQGFLNLRGLNFNPRPREEGDVSGANLTIIVRQFQSTPS